MRVVLKPVSMVFVQGVEKIIWRREKRNKTEARAEKTSEPHSH